MKTVRIQKVIEHTVAVIACDSCSAPNEKGDNAYDVPSGWYAVRIVGAEEQFYYCPKCGEEKIGRLS